MNNPLKILYYNSILFGIILGIYFSQYFELITTKVFIFVICVTVSRFGMFFALSSANNVICSLCVMIAPVIIMLLGGTVYKICGGIIFLIGAFALHNIPDSYWEK